MDCFQQPKILPWKQYQIIGLIFSNILKSQIDYNFLFKSLHGLHQASVKFKQEVVARFKANYFRAANSAKTILIQCEGTSVLTHCLYADDFLYHTKDAGMCRKKINRTSPNRLRLNLEMWQSILVIGSLLIQTNWLSVLILFRLST